MSANGTSRKDSVRSRGVPGQTPKEIEDQAISAAYDLAARQIEEGTASSQVITHFLKLGSSRERLEQERMEMEIEVGKAKIEAMAAHGRIEELYAQAIVAMSSYQPTPDPVQETYELA